MQILASAAALLRSRSPFQKAPWVAYWSGKRQPEHGPDNKQFYLRHAAELRVMLQDIAYESVLDLGCGNGAFYELLGFNQKVHTGVDFSDAMLSAFRESWPQARLVHADASAYLEDTSYDLIFCNGVIQHCDAAMLQRMIGNVRRMMGPDSVMFGGCIPWRGHRSAYFQGGPPWSREVGLGRRLVRRFMWRILQHPMGHWYEPRDIAAIAEQHGLSAEFFGSICYPGRFHFLLRIKQ